MKFDLSAAWDDALRIFRGSWQLMLVIAGIFVLLPNLALSFAMPDMMTGSMFGDIPADAEPEQVFAQIGPMIGALMVSVIALLVIQAIGQMAMMAVTDRARPTVGQAIGIAFRALPTMIGVFALAILGYILIAIALILPVGLIGAAGSEGGAAVLAVLLIPLFMVVFGYLATRLSMVMPAIILGGERNPVVAFKASWQTTKGSAWRLFAYYVLLVIAYLIISMVAGLVFGGLALVGGGFEPGNALSIGMIVNFLFSSILAAFVAAFATAIFAAVWFQLAGEGAAIAETFD